MCESMEPKVSISYCYYETLLQFTLARGFKEDVGIGRNVMSPLCYASMATQNQNSCSLCQSCSLNPFHDPLTHLPEVPHLQPRLIPHT